MWTGGRADLCAIEKNTNFAPQNKACIRLNILESELHQWGLLKHLLVLNVPQEINKQINNKNSMQCRPPYLKISSQCTVFYHSM